MSLINNVTAETAKNSFGMSKEEKLKRGYENICTVNLVLSNIVEYICFTSYLSFQMNFVAVMCLVVGPY